MTKPPRPSLTTAFTSACLLWISCAIAYDSGRMLDAGQCLAGSLVSLTLGLAAAAVILVMRKPLAIAAALALCFGAALGFVTASNMLSSSNALGTQSFSDILVTLEGDSASTATGESALLKARLPDGRDIVVYGDFGTADPMLRGETWRVSGTLKAPDFSKDGYLWQCGAQGRLNVTSFEEVADLSPLHFLKLLREKAIVAIGDSDDVHALLQAIACGYRHSVRGTEIYAQFQQCGLAHLIAVSGAHLLIVTGMIATLLKRLAVSRRVSVVILALTMASYLVFSGMPISAIRATAMSTISLFSIIGQRRPSALNALGIGMMAIIASSPIAAVSVSFALSALSTMGIVIFSPLVASCLNELPLKAPAMIGDALAMTISSNILSLLYAGSIFKVLPLASPVSNVACAPLFPIVCISGLLCCAVSCLGLPFAAGAVDLATFATYLLSQVASTISAIPLSTVPVSLCTPLAVMLTALMAIGLWAIWPTIHAKHVMLVFATCSTLAIALFMATANEDAIIMLDVGQGDSFLIRSKGQTLLVDTGNKDDQLLDQLAKCSVLQLDTVLLTHTDDDHIGSLDALERSVHVKRILLADGLQASASEKNVDAIDQSRRSAEAVAYVKAGDAFKIGRFSAKVLWPFSLSADGANADSICLLLEYDGDEDGVVDSNAMLTGDAEASEVGSVLKKWAIRDIDVLKVGHHGSEGGLSETQAATLSPNIALISVGANNRYGHPAQGTLTLLESVGCKVYRSDLNGQVKCLFSSDGISVRLQ